MGHTESGSRRTGGVTMRGTCAALSAAQRAYVAHDPYWPMRLPAWTPPGPAAWPCATPRGRRSPRCAGGGKALHQRGPRQPQDAGHQPRARDNTLSGHDQRTRRRHGSGAAATRLTARHGPSAVCAADGSHPDSGAGKGSQDRRGPSPTATPLRRRARPPNANYGKPPAGRSIASCGPTAPVAAITAARTAAPPHSATDRSLASTAASWHESVLTARSVFPAR